MASSASNSVCGSWDRREINSIMHDDNIFIISPNIIEFGAWSTTGCKEVIVDGSSNVRSCECRQLAHFGVLLVSDSYL